MASKFDEEYTITDSHIPLRIVLFVLSVLVLFFCVGIGVTQLVKKNPGYYEIIADANDEAPLYANGITFNYYFDGTSNEIRAQQNALKKLYSDSLLRTYKLLDEKCIYPEIVNVAFLNKYIGEEIEVGDELFSVLLDQWEKTCEGNCVNLFSGALLSEWDNVLSLSDMSDFAPCTNEEFKNRIETLAQKTSDISNFSASFDEKNNRVKFEVSKNYFEFIKENEFCSEIITLGRLSDAYRLEMIKNVLEENGFSNGFLSTKSGLVLSLSSHDKGEYSMYGFENGKVSKGPVFNAGKNTAFSFLRTFPMEDGELFYHIIENRGKLIFYNPNFRLCDGGFSDLIVSSGVSNHKGDIVLACYQNLSLYQAETKEELQASAEKITGNTTCVILEVQ